jgi:hypothetical protein
MQKIPFDISEIRVTKSSLDGYGLNIFLKPDTQLKCNFHDEMLYKQALEANGKLTKL